MKTSLKNYHEILRIRKKIHDYEDRKKALIKENRELEIAIKKIREMGSTHPIDELNNKIKENEISIENLERKITKENATLEHFLVPMYKERRKELQKEDYLLKNKYGLHESIDRIEFGYYLSYQATLYSDGETFRFPDMMTKNDSQIITRMYYAGKYFHPEINVEDTDEVDLFTGVWRLAVCKTARRNNYLNYILTFKRESIHGNNCYITLSIDNHGRFKVRVTTNMNDLLNEYYGYSPPQGKNILSSEIEFPEKIYSKFPSHLRDIVLKLLTGLYRFTEEHNDKITGKLLEENKVDQGLNIPDFSNHFSFSVPKKFFLANENVHPLFGILECSPSYAVEHCYDIEFDKVSKMRKFLSGMERRFRKTGLKIKNLESGGFAANYESDHGLPQIKIYPKGGKYLRIEFTYNRGFFKKNGVRLSRLLSIKEMREYERSILEAVVGCITFYRYEKIEHLEAFYQWIFDVNDSIDKKDFVKRLPYSKKFKRSDVEKIFPEYKGNTLTYLLKKLCEFGIVKKKSPRIYQFTDEGWNTVLSLRCFIDRFPYSQEENYAEYYSWMSRIPYICSGFNTLTETEGIT